MNIVRTNEYGKGGRMKEALAKYLGSRRYENGGEFTGDGKPFKPGQAYVMSGYENRPDEEGLVSGRERMYIAIPGEGGTRTLDIAEAMKEFGYSNPVEMLKAIGVETERQEGGGFTVPGMEDSDYRRRLMAALAQEGEGYRELQDRLGVGRVDYNRERDLPNIINAAGGPGGY